jgi:hypothetical protein
MDSKAGLEHSDTLATHVIPSLVAYEVALVSDYCIGAGVSAVMRTWHHTRG